MSPSSTSNDARPAAARAPSSSTSGLQPISHAASSGSAATAPPKRDDHGLLHLARVTAQGVPHQIFMREVKPTAPSDVATTRLFVQKVDATEMTELANPLGLAIPAVSALDAANFHRVRGVSSETDVVIVNSAEGTFGFNLVSKRVYPIVDAETTLFASSRRARSPEDCSITCEGDNAVRCWSGAWPPATRDAFRAKGTWNDGNQKYTLTSHARAVEVGMLVAYLDGTDPEDVGDLRNEARLPVLLDLVDSFGLDDTITGRKVAQELLRFAALPVHAHVIKAQWLVGTADYYEAITQSNVAGGMEADDARVPIPSVVQQVVTAFATELRDLLLADVAEPGLTSLDTGKLGDGALFKAIDSFLCGNMAQELEDARQQAAIARAARFEALYLQHQQLYLQQQETVKKLQEEVARLSNALSNCRKRIQETTGRENFKKSRKATRRSEDEGDHTSDSEDGEVSSDDKPLKKGTSQEPRPAKTAEKARPPRGN